MRFPNTRTAIITGIGMIYFWATPVSAICLAQDMDGTWFDPLGAIKKLEIDFTCPDTQHNVPGQPPPEPPPAAYITAWGPCESVPGACSWGRVPVTYDFISIEDGVQTTRLDAVYDDEVDKRTLVILRINPDKLLVFMSVEFPDNSESRNFSTIQYFTKDANCHYWRGSVICRDPRFQQLHIRELAEEAGP